MGIKEKPWLEDVELLDDAVVSFSTTIRDKTITGDGHVFDVRDDGLIFIESSTNSTGGYAWVYAKPVDIIAVKQYGKLANLILNPESPPVIDDYSRRYFNLVDRLKQIILDEGL